MHIGDVIYIRIEPMHAGGDKCFIRVSMFTVLSVFLYLQLDACLTCKGKTGASNILKKLVFLLVL